MHWGIVFWLVLCIPYDVYALVRAMRSGRHPAPYVYMFLVPSAGMLTGIALISIAEKFSLSAFIWLFVIAVIIEFVALGTLIVANRRYRRSLTAQP